MGNKERIVVVGGTRSIGLEVVKHYAGRGFDVVLTGRRPENVEEAVAAASGLGGNVSGVAFDLARPHDIGPALADVGPVRYLALVALERDDNSVRSYHIDRAIRLVTLKLVGFSAVVHALASKFDDESAIVLYGGMAKERPYPGSTTISTVNAGTVGLTRTLVEELKPVRVNSLHPGIVGDSPYWAEKPAAIENYSGQSPLGRLATMDDIVGATAFLLENRAVNGVDLIVDCGWHCR
jgi:NAD(P)-dependent dehydrogenase (short-subunit alcohol dehydrogenase family)